MRSVKFCVVLFVVLVFVAAEESERQPSDAELQSEGEKSTKEEVRPYLFVPTSISRAYEAPSKG